MGGRYCVITYGGLKFEFTDDYEFSLTIAETSLPGDRSAIRGLCGNYNSEPYDDLVLLGGGKATSVAAYVNSYALTQVSGPVSQDSHFMENI